MKLLIFSSMLLLGLNSHSMASVNSSKLRDRMPDFYVMNSEEDASLDENHAQFVIHFSGFKTSDYKATIPQIELSCNGVIRSFELDSTDSYSIEVAPGDYTFVLSAGNQYYEVFSHKITISGGVTTHARCSFRQVEQPILNISPGNGGVISYKPVIYTYADSPIAVSVELDPLGEFTFTYPEYGENWSGTAHPDGSFTMNGKNYQYLFWEGTSDHLARLQDFSEGFLVEKVNVISFLEKQLTEIGFNDKERTDFITFWGPRMTQSEKGIARFLVNAQYDRYVADLTVSPKPEHMYRFYLLWTPVDGTFNQEIKPQQLPKLERGGLTIVEWGGSEIPMEIAF